MSARPTLTVCSATDAPAARHAAILEPLRAVADEIVLVADSRVGADALAGYAQLADSVHRIAFDHAGRHEEWMHAQCSGEWILMLDGDEVPSASLLARLPEMLAARDVRQYVIPRLWLYPDERQVLGDLPWSADWITRLVRNEPALRFPGRRHVQVAVATPRAFVEEPLYHLELVFSDERSRRTKSVVYEVSRPGLVARGGGRLNEAFYLPELRDRLTLHDVPAEDRALLARVLDPPPLPPTGPAPEFPVVPGEENDALWEGRPLGPGAYAATLEPLESRTRVAPGEHVELLLRVHNAGDARWPWSLDHQPQVRLGHRWFDAAGLQLGGEGPRTPFPKRVRPGERLLAPVVVVAPEEPGSYELEIDVVHEGVRWFGAACRIAVEVTPECGLPPARERLVATAAPAANGAEQLIPRVIHRVWLGSDALPDEQREFGEGFARLHPGWEQRVWGDADLEGLGISPQVAARARSASELSDLVRYAVLAQHGGVYVDTDVECRKPLDGLLAGVEAFAGLEQPGRLGTAVIGSVPGHPLLLRAAREAQRTVGTGANSADANGPLFFTLLAEQEPGLTIFPVELFYPYLYTDRERRHEDFPAAYLVHHWAVSWRAELDTERGGGA